MQTEGKRQFIKHKITWCFIRRRAGFMGTRWKMAYILSPSRGEWTARPGVAGHGGGSGGARRTCGFSAAFLKPGWGWARGSERGQGVHSRITSLLIWHISVPETIQSILTPLSHSAVPGTPGGRYYFNPIIEIRKLRLHDAPRS